MELKSFREILFKKAEGNDYLQTLIKYAKDELLADEVIESLLKMAEPSAAMGRGANHAVTTYGSTIKPTHIEQLRDAIAHHISHYRAALKGHHEATDASEKAKLRAIADQHLEKIVPMLHLAGKAAKHSGGQLVLDYPSMTPWETNYTTTERLPNGKLKEGTKDLGRRPAKNADRTKNKRAVTDYRYLEMAPHPDHAATPKMSHRGAYPFEEIQLGSPTKRDAGQAYLPIEDVGSVTEYVPHPFDAHPVHALADMSEKDLTEAHRDQFNKNFATWADSEHHKKWLETQKEKFQKDPEGYKKRGQAKPSHPFEGIPLAAQPESGSTSQAQLVPVPAAPTKVEKTPEEHARDAWQAMSPDQKKALAHLFPQFSGKK